MLSLRVVLVPYSPLVCPVELGHPLLRLSRHPIRIQSRENEYHPDLEPQRVRARLLPHWSIGLNTATSLHTLATNDMFCFVIMWDQQCGSCSCIREIAFGHILMSDLVKCAYKREPNQAAS